jgi:hypothetical protein
VAEFLGVDDRTDGADAVAVDVDVDVTVDVDGEDVIRPPSGSNANRPGPPLTWHRSNRAPMLL